MTELVAKAAVTLLMLPLLGGCLGPKRFDEVQWRARVEATRAEPVSRPALELERAAVADPWLRERLRILPVGARLLLD